MTEGHHGANGRISCDWIRCWYQRNLVGWEIMCVVVLGQIPARQSGVAVHA